MGIYYELYREGMYCVQPMEDGVVTISRAAGRARFSAKFILVAASNPCPCGYLGDLKHECKCTPSQVIRYRKRISGPIVDRIDLHVEVPAVEVNKLTDKLKTETSAVIRKRVQKARNQQIKRLEKANLVCNAEMTNRGIKEFCPLSRECLRLLRQAVSQLALSARGYYKIVKISRTIADLSGEEEIAPEHIAEALQYRPKNRSD